MAFGSRSSRQPDGAGLTSPLAPHTCLGGLAVPVAIFALDTYPISVSVSYAVHYIQHGCTCKPSLLSLSLSLSRARARARVLSLFPLALLSSVFPTGMLFHKIHTLLVFVVFESTNCLCA